MRRAIAAGLALFLSAGAAAPASACGADTDCEVAGGSYRISLPPDSAAHPVPAVIFLHGWQATAAGVMRNRNLRTAMDDLGVALIAPQGMGKTWSYPGSPSQRRDEFAFFDALRADILARYPVDPARIVVSGFSMGGSMVWNLACRRGSDYAAFLPFAGAFWDPIPQDCDDPARVLLHTHGTSDTVVPIVGRAIGESFRQSDAHDSMAALAQATGELLQRTACEALDTCTKLSGAATRYEFRTHPGGHIWRADWLAAMVSDVLGLAPGGDSHGG